jgi:hypothetical protein
LPETPPDEITEATGKESVADMPSNYSKEYRPANTRSTYTKYD